MTPEEFLAKIDGYDPSFEVVHSAFWSGYDESAFMFILRKADQLYSLHHLYSVFAQDERPSFEPFPVSEEQALDIMLNWDEMELRRES